jgi:hypothetical protein
MVLKGLLFVILIILSGVSVLVSFIFFVMRLAQDHPKKWNWLIAVAVSIVIMIGSIMIFVGKVVNKATEFGQTMEQKFEKAVEESALNSKQDFHYELLDSNRNETITLLKEFEKINGKENVPDEFYAYLGFMDYYRMPLTYPYSLHCSDVLETASLFNEKNVSEFNKSENGEVDCKINFITAFAFDNKMLVAKQKFQDGDKYVLYDFTSGEQLSFGSQKEAFSKAKKLEYRGPDTLVTVLQYYRKLNP